MVEKNNNTNKSIDSSNIFDDFVNHESLRDELNTKKMEDKKDIYFYVSKMARILQVAFFAGLILVVILFAYIKIQNNSEIKNSNILDPFCFVILGDIYNLDPFCSSVSSLKQTYSNKLKKLQSEQVTSISDVLLKLYEIENFTKAKEIVFLKAKSQKKLKVLTILEEFDKMKNEFDKIDKQKIQCNKLLIDAQKSFLSMECRAYSAGYERGLRGFDGVSSMLVKGTSLSIANSFLNYISKQSSIFTIVDRQKIFKSELMVGEKTDFTNVTKFSLKLKYNIK